MGFLTPWFLAGVAAVGLPVWLHLLRKHKTTPLPFSSLMFFERRTQSSIKHRRLRYLLLFAAAHGAHPAAGRSPSRNPSSAAACCRASRTGEIAVVAIDNSFSMRAGNRLEHAPNSRRARSSAAAAPASAARCWRSASASR